MKTQLLDCSHGKHLDEMLEEAALCLREGGLVAFPTETVYGLGGNALHDASVAEIYRVKGRPQDNPLIVHLSTVEDLPQVAEAVSEEAMALFSAYAPGPLTLVLKRHPKIPPRVSAGLDTVAVRIPDNYVASSLIRLAAVPVVAPSANLSGRPSPTRAWHVREDMDGKIPYIIDGGPCRFGVESTVLDMSGDEPAILRPGAITQDMLEKILKRHVCLPGELRRGSAEAAPRAPGMKYRHYAPKARVVILYLEKPKQLQKQLEEALQQPGRLSFYLSDDAASLLQRMRTDSEALVRSYGQGASSASAGLFDAFRSFDEAGADVIFVEARSEEGEGLAFMNRLKKAASAEKLPQPGNRHGL